MTVLKIVYIANIVVAGWISITSLFFPKTAQLTVFSNDFAYSEAIRLVGALWGAIFLLSVLALFFVVWVIGLPFVIDWKWLFD